VNKDSQAGRLVTQDQALEFFTRVHEAEKTLGPLSLDERMAILNTIGTEVTLEDLRDTIRGKRVLVVRSKEDDTTGK